MNIGLLNLPLLLERELRACLRCVELVKLGIKRSARALHCFARLEPSYHVQPISVLPGQQRFPLHYLCLFGEWQPEVWRCLYALSEEFLRRRPDNRKHHAI